MRDRKPQAHVWVMCSCISICRMKYLAKVTASQTIPKCQLVCLVLFLEEDAKRVQHIEIKEANQRSGLCNEEIIKGLQTWHRSEICKMRNQEAVLVQIESISGVITCCAEGHQNGCLIHDHNMMNDLLDDQPRLSDHAYEPTRPINYQQHLC